MKSNLIFFFIFLVFFNVDFLAQKNENRWTAGIHLGSVMYSDIDGKEVGGAFIDQLPRITLSRYMFKNVTFQAAFSTSLLDEQKYTTFDGVAKYDFGTYYDNLSPYILIGGSFIDATRLTPTLNIGAGNTFWLFPNYGLNLELIYKFSETRFESQRSHLYPTVGIVYSFKPRNMRRRLWDYKH